MDPVFVMDSLARPAAAGLINGLIAGLLLTLGVAVILRFGRRLNAGTRYGVWWVALAAIVGLTLGFMALSSKPPAFRDPPAPARGEPTVDLPDTMSATALMPGQLPAPTRPPRARPPVAETAPDSGRWAPLVVSGGSWSLTLMLVWVVGAAGGMLRLGFHWLRLQRFRRRARLIEPEPRLADELALRRGAFQRNFRLAVAPGITIPTVAGFLRPLILFPEAMVNRLTPEEFRQVVLHEAAHLRRWDDWANLLQQVVTALFFCQPAVRWIGRRLSEEREIACDDWVVSATGRRRSYILCLSRVLELAAGVGAAMPSPGAVHTRQILRRRIEMLLDKQRNHNPRPSRWLLLGAIVLLGLTALLFARELSFLQITEPDILPPPTAACTDIGAPPPDAQPAEATPTDQPQSAPAAKDEARLRAEQAAAEKKCQELEAHREQLEKKLQFLEQKIDAVGQQINGALQAKM